MGFEEKKEVVAESLSFESSMRRKNQGDFGGSIIRYEIACALAKATDEGNIICINALSHIIEVSHSAIINNIQSLRAELSKLGIVLQERVLKKLPRYSLAWTEESVAAPVEARVEEPLSRPPEPLKKPKKPRVVTSGSAESTPLPPSTRPAAIDRAVLSITAAAEEDRREDPDSDRRMAAIRRAAERYKAHQVASKDPKRVMLGRDEKPRSVFSGEGRLPAQKEIKARVSELKFAIEADKKLKPVAQTIADYINSVTTVAKVYPDGQYTGEPLILRIREEREGGYIVASNMRRFSDYFGTYGMVFASKIAEAFGREAYSIQVAIRDIK